MTRRQRTVFLASVACSLAAAGSLTGQATAPDRQLVVRQLDSLADDFLAHGLGASVAIAVVRGEDTIAMLARGYANVSKRRAATASTIYHLGSLTKQFTAAIVLRLAERHQLNLDDTIGYHLRSIPDAWRSITIRRLLNHTSGLHNYTEMPGGVATWKNDLTPQQLIKPVTALPLDFPPGTQWAYSNTGYVVLGMIVEKVTGLSYSEVVVREIFTPLGMTRSLYCPSKPARESGIAVGYSAQGGKLVPARYISMTQPYAAGALCSSLGDFVRWQNALSSGRVVAPASYRSMTTPETLRDGRSLNYGFGLGVGDFEGHRSVRHDGAVHGFQSFAAHFPADSLHVVLFSSTDAPAFDRLVQAVQRAALGLPLSGPRR